MFSCRIISLTCMSNHLFKAVVNGPFQKFGVMQRSNNYVSTMNSMIVNYDWSPLKDVEHLEFNLGAYAVLILNQPILVPPETMTAIWNNALFRSTVDGGTDRWFSFLEKNKLDVENKFPDTVSGDFDSILPNTLEYCRENGVDITHTPDMDKTDFTKALEVIAQKCEEELETVAAIVDSTGRLDQIFSNINTLLKIQEIFHSDRINGYLLTFNSITWILRPGYHKIHIPERLRQTKSIGSNWCGILPFAPRQSTVTTTGLKWNLRSSQIEFGGLISSSNTFSGDPLVTVETDTELIWCMSLGAEG